MNAQAVAQVAKFLKVSPNQIKRCEEWSKVLFVVVVGSRPQFVSKKVLVMESLEERMKRWEREEDEKVAKAEAMAARISDMLPISDCTQYDKLYSAAIEVLEGESTLEEVVDRFSRKK